MSKRNNNVEPRTTAQRLGSILKYCRDKMRTDKGLSGELDRIPVLTWIIFLKFFDDDEKIREAESIIRGAGFTPAIEFPYRWRDWATQDDGITGSELISFINNEEAIRPDGTRGLGLFPYLRQLHGDNGGDRRDIIANVFRETYNRMLNGYLLRDIINKIDILNFKSTDEIHTLAFLYETMLKELRDAAGDSGEFYTPRPVIKFMVNTIDPQLGETILDPACGTGGFLVEAYSHLKDQCKTTKDFDTLQRKSIFGGEAKPLPYLLGLMNMLLHGIEFPQIDYGNSLRLPLREIGDKDRVDIILTNPPFGGEEERSILRNFPPDKQTSETALLFLQLIMRKLKRKKGENRGGRCGVIVPKGIFSRSIAEKITKELTEQFNLHTIIQLPAGVFSPYTNVEVSILFFELHEINTKNIWFYEVPLPKGRNRYTKTIPLKYEDLNIVLDWLNDKNENENSWLVSIDDVIANNYNLDYKNPNINEVEVIRKPSILLDSLKYHFNKLSTLITQIEKLRIDEIKIIDESFNINNSIFIELANKYGITQLINSGIGINSNTINPKTKYKNNVFQYIDISSVEKFSGKLINKKEIIGNEAPSRARRYLSKDDVVFSSVRPNLKKCFVVNEEQDGNICSTGFFVFSLNESEINPYFLKYQLLSDFFINQCMEVVTGGHYPALSDKNIKKLSISIPPIEIQERVVYYLDKIQLKNNECIQAFRNIEIQLSELSKSMNQHIIKDL